MIPDITCDVTCFWLDHPGSEPFISFLRVGKTSLFGLKYVKWEYVKWEYVKWEYVKWEEANRFQFRTQCSVSLIPRLFLIRPDNIWGSGPFTSTISWFMWFTVTTPHFCMRFLQGHLCKFSKRFSAVRTKDRDYSARINMHTPPYNQAHGGKSITTLYLYLQLWWRVQSSDVMACHDSASKCNIHRPSHNQAVAVINCCSNWLGIKCG